MMAKEKKQKTKQQKIAGGIRLFGLFLLMLCLIGGLVIGAGALSWIIDGIAIGLLTGGTTMVVAGPVSKLGCAISNAIGGNKNNSATQEQELTNEKDLTNEEELNQENKITKKVTKNEDLGDIPVYDDEDLEVEFVEEKKPAKKTTNTAKRSGR